MSGVYNQSGTINLNSSTFTNLRTDVPEGAEAAMNASSSFTFGGQTFTFVRWKVNGVNQPLNDTVVVTSNITGNIDFEAEYAAFI